MKAAKLAGLANSLKAKAKIVDEINVNANQQADSIRSIVDEINVTAMISNETSLNDQVLDCYSSIHLKDGVVAAVAAGGPVGAGSSNNICWEDDEAKLIEWDEKADADSCGDDEQVKLP